VNRYNAPEVLSALLQALEVAGLSEVVARIKQMGVPRMVNEAWSKRPKTARANVEPIRQRTQFSCMSTSMTMCLKANGLQTTEDEVNRVMGARPMAGASWEDAIASAQHFGMRVHLICPATLEQVKTWTDQGIPVMIAWNPEGRPWSHASVIFDVDQEHTVWVADPNIPDPSQTVRVVPKEEFYKKWSENRGDYLVRRTALAVMREITPEGKQVVASEHTTKQVGTVTRVPRSIGTPALGYYTVEIDGEEYMTSSTPRELDRGAKIQFMAGKTKDQAWGGRHWAMDILVRKVATYSGNPNGKPIYPHEVDHGYDQPLAGGSDVMKRLQNKLLQEQGQPQRPDNPRLATTDWHRPPSAEDFKRNPKAGKLYGAYTFWLMHHDGSPSQKARAGQIEKLLDRMDFNQWGLAVDLWPDAAKEYLFLCKQYGIKPEAVRTAQRVALRHLADLNWKGVAQNLLDRNKGTAQSDLHYRAYLRAVVDGQPAGHLTDQFAGARAARNDLIDEVGKGKYAGASPDSLARRVAAQYLVLLGVPNG